MLHDQVMEAPISLPGSLASWDAIWGFALTYNGYERFGQDVGDFANDVEAE